MIEVSKCVICDGHIHRLKRALVAPFLARRIWNKAPFLVDLVQCEACSFMFYNPRLDDGDLRRLYANYHAPEYQQMRHASEPWYTPKFNADLFSAGSYDARRAVLGPILRQNIGDRKIARILDYGGDRGDLIVGLIDGTEAFVYDISGIPPRDGVTAVSDAASCNADLIINSNVLEHIGFPRPMVAEMLEAATPGGLVYLEVPCESPFGFKRLVRRVAQIGVVSLARPALAASVVRPAALYMMHEHINYYSEQSLKALMRSAGGTVIASGSTLIARGRYPVQDVVWCLGSNAASPS